MRERRPAISGWLNILKPREVSSAFFVRKVGAILNNHFSKQFGKNSIKIGHAGTLDPFADGVLPVAVGEATKLIDYVMDDRKSYEFFMQFGAKTDTADRTGTVVEKSDKFPTKYDLQNILQTFIGLVEQSPHVFSAIKINGKRAYELARDNVEFSIPKRNVTIFNIELLNYDEISGVAHIFCECSKGTYIRSLCEDIAFLLQNVGFVLELRRLMVGPFKIQDSLVLNVSDVDTLLQNCLKNIMSVDAVLDDIPVFDANDEQAFKLRSGQVVPVSSLLFGNDIVCTERYVAVYYMGNLLCMCSVVDNFLVVKRGFNLSNCGVFDVDKT